MRAARGKLVAFARDKIKDDCLSTNLTMFPARIRDARLGMDLGMHIGNTVDPRH